MATTLWNVMVTSLRACELRLDVTRAHEDAGAFPSDVVFALRLLYEQARRFDPDTMAFAPSGPLGEAVGEDDIYDDGWLGEHAGDYVAQVTLESGGDAGAVGAVARYRIAVTSPRWLAHLAGGQSRRSAAYS
jgi:hypothetical protein